MSLFHVLDEVFVITRNKGVFRQCKVFVRGDHVYAAHGAGFVRLMGHGGTSIPTMVWDGLTEHPDIAIRFSQPSYAPRTIAGRAAPKRLAAE